MRVCFLVLGQGASIGVSHGWRAGVDGELWTVSHLNVVERKSVDEERTATLPLHGVTWRRMSWKYGVTWRRMSWKYGVTWRKNPWKYSVTLGGRYVTLF